MSLLTRATVPALVLGLWAAPGPAVAQNPPRVEPQVSQATPAPPAAGVPTEFDQDAERTREQLSQILERYPPGLRSVLRLDPTLLTNQQYLAPYPMLAAFLAQHPEVAHNPSYFVGTPNSPSPFREDPESRRARIAADVMMSALVFTGIMALLGVIAWSIKMVVDHRRWLRVTRVQTEAHSKVLDRLASNDDLLSYIQSPAGRRFLEAAPAIPAAAAAGAPLGRILFSVQVGSVALLTGLGLLILSSRMARQPGGVELSPVLMMFGIVVLAAGAGFILSAAVSFVLSRKLGLLATPDSSNA